MERMPPTDTKNILFFTMKGLNERASFKMYLKNTIFIEKEGYETVQ